MTERVNFKSYIIDLTTYTLQVYPVSNKGLQEHNFREILGCYTVIMIPIYRKRANLYLMDEHTSTKEAKNQFITDLPYWWHIFPMRETSFFLQSWISQNSWILHHVFRRTPKYHKKSPITFRWGAQIIYFEEKNSAIGLETNNLLKCLRVITIKYLTIHFILQFCNQIKLDICVWWSQAFKEIKDSPKDIMLELKTLH